MLYVYIVKAAAVVSEKNIDFLPRILEGIQMIITYVILCQLYIASCACLS